MFEFTFDFTYFHGVTDIWCTRSYLVYQTLTILFSILVGDFIARTSSDQGRDFCSDVNGIDLLEVPRP